MSITVSEFIKAPKEKVWETIVDIEGAERRISGITQIKILERPKTGIIGLKWEETRVMFGKEAIETMWISAAKENEWYETTAYNCGAKYNSKLQIEESTEGLTKLTMSFNSTPQTLLAKLFVPLGFLFKGAIRKAIKKDLQDIQVYLEGA